MTLFQQIIYKSIFIGCKVFRRNHFFATLSQVNTITDGLSILIKDSNYKIDLIIPILDGGYYPAKRLSHQLKTPLVGIDICHYHVILVGINLVYLPFIATIMRKYFKIYPTLKSPFNLDIKNKNILIVDDDVESGATLSYAIEIIKQQNPKEIKTAILSNYRAELFVDFEAPNVIKVSSVLAKKKNKFQKSVRIKWPWEPISPHYPQLSIHGGDTTSVESDAADLLGRFRPRFQGKRPSAP